MLACHIIPSSDGSPVPAAASLSVCSPESVDGAGMGLGSHAKQGCWDLSPIVCCWGRL